MDKDLRHSELYERRFEDGESKSSFLFYVVFLVLIFAVLLFRAYWTENFGGVIVDGSSMRNTLYDGDKLLIRYVEDGKGLERGDVIVVNVGGYEECSGVNGGFLIKRLIATEGDKVKCIDGQIYLWKAGSDGYEAIEEDYDVWYDNKMIGKDENGKIVTGAAAYDFGEYVVGEGEIFFLGDNRHHSCDSRYNQPAGSHLKGKLYKATDVFGVVPEWAIKHSETLEKIFF
ncbi:MAG: signal peptidase I [Clostridia bacterium]|nr:signal peptidase I [Clostridia bacterium]